MNWHNLWKGIKRASPVICTALGVAGVIGTAVMTAKNTPRAIERIEKKQAEQEEPLKPMEKVMAAAPAYLPAAGVGALTIALIITSNVLSKKQNASLAAACALLQRNYRDHKNKVRELYGKEGEERIEREIARDHARENLPEKPDNCEEGLHLYYEPYTKHYFWAFDEDVLYAEINVNSYIAHYGYCSLAKYCEFLDIPAPDGAENIGWDEYDFANNWEGINWVDFSHQFVESPEEDIPPYYIIWTDIPPEYDYELEERPGVELCIDENGCYDYYTVR